MTMSHTELTLCIKSFLVEELSRQIRDSGATYLFTNEELAPKSKISAVQTQQIKVVDHTLLKYFA